MAGRVIASAIDDNYVLPLLLMAHSAIKNSSDDFKFMVGYSKSSLSGANRQFLSDVLVKLGMDFELKEIIIDVESVYEDYLTEITYARLYFADSLESSFLWVDADIVLKDGWDEIFQIGSRKLDSYVLVGSRDPITQNRTELSETNNAALKIAGSDYINAGFIYVDVLAWRKLGFNQNWKSLQSRYVSLGFQYQDQCVLNHLLFGHIMIVGNQFNQLVKEGVEIYSESPKVLHFSGGDKPWNHTFFNLMFKSSRTMRTYQKSFIYNALSFHFSIFLKSPRVAYNSWRRLRDLNQDLTIVKMCKILLKKVFDFKITAKR